MRSDVALSYSHQTFALRLVRLACILLTAGASTVNAAQEQHAILPGNAEPPSAQHADTPQIAWRVAIPFSPFRWLAQHAKASVTATAVPRPEESFQQWAYRVSTSSDRSPFAHFLAPAHQASANRTTTALTPATPNPWDDRRPGYRPAYVHPKSTEILVSLKGAGPHASCRWRQQEGPLSTPAPCSAEILLEHVPLTGARIQVQIEDDPTPITAQVDIDHKVVVAIGDSYASGEGNPDIPARWHSDSVAKDTYQWLNTSLHTDARWWNDTCHRSFYSNQTFVALRLAFDSPHRLVTYLHYACSGAEVFDGLLVPQETPPGISGSCRGKDCLLPKSQLAMMVQDLCMTPTTRLGANTSVIQRIQQLASPKDMLRMRVYQRAGLNLHACPDGMLRQPDLILLSIGGNDIGFSSLVAWALLPERYWFNLLKQGISRGIVCPDDADRFDSRCNGRGKKAPVKAGTLISQLPPRLEALYLALAHVLHPDIANRIVQVNYPDPMRKDENALCHDPSGLNKAGPWASLSTQVPLIARLSGWHFNAVQSEVDILSNKTLPSMSHTLQQAITRNGAHFIDLQDAFRDHGWCQQHQASEPPIALPSAATGPQAQAWTCHGIPRDPSCWNAYAPSQRYIRTANDAFLTQSSKSRDDGLFGAMHPNMSGHAEMAARIYPAAKRVLQ